MRFFWKKCKNRLSVGSYTPEPPLAAVGDSAPRPRVVTPA